MVVNRDRLLKKRILHIINDLQTGGAETMLLKLLSQQHHPHSDTAVLTLVDGGPIAQEIRDLGVLTYSLGLKSKSSTPGSLLRLSQFLRRFRPSLIQGWMYHGNLAALLSKTLLLSKCPVLWNIRHSLYDLRKEKGSTALCVRLGARMSRHVAGVLYNSYESASQHEVLGYRKDKTQVIPNGFDVKRFSPSRLAREELRASVNIPSGWRVVGMVGRYHPMKDHHTFLLAARRLLGLGHKVVFILAGRGVNKSNSELTTKIRDLDLLEHVRLLGEQPAVEKVFAALDIASLSSSWGESFPNVIGEAMACEVPCVATDIGDVSRVIADTGIVVPAQDPQALAIAWDTLLQRSDDELKVAKGEETLTIPEIFDTLTEAVFSEVATQQNVSAIRQNLQRTYADRLIRMTLRHRSGPAITQSLARTELEEIKGLIEAMKGQQTDAYTTAHLKDTLRRIDQTLEAHALAQ